MPELRVVALGKRFVCRGTLKRHYGPPGRNQQVCMVAEEEIRSEPLENVACVDTSMKNVLYDKTRYLAFVYSFMFVPGHYIIKNTAHQQPIDHHQFALREAGREETCVERRDEVQDEEEYAQRAPSRSSGVLYPRARSAQAGSTPSVGKASLLCFFFWSCCTSK